MRVTAARVALLETILTASDDHGFSIDEIDEAEVIYWGLCPDCSTARSA